MNVIYRGLHLQVKKYYLYNITAIGSKGYGSRPAVSRDLHARADFRM